MYRYLPAGLLIALVVVCVSAATVSQPASFVSGLEDATAGIQEPQQRDGATSDSRGHAPTSTLPLRWRVAWAAEGHTTDPNFCATIVSVRNLTSSSVSVDVEWFVGNGTSLALRNLSIGAGLPREFVTDADILLDPFAPNDDAGLGTFEGFAEVFADDPRIHATAYLLCREGIDPGFSINSIPTFPVGATLEFFQAGMPATWMTPLATPEGPE